jgi:hypothetical protein
MEPLTKLVHDVATGEITIIELTDEEIAQLVIEPTPTEPTDETPSPD